MHTTWLLRLYPPHWRERYEEEFTALLEDYPVTLSLIVDVMRGALDAHLHPYFTDRRVTSMSAKLRAAEMAIFCAYIGFVVAGLGFQKMTEYDDFVSAARTHTAVGVAFNIIVISSVVALLAVLVGGFPIVAAAVRQALAERRKDVLLLFAVPLLTFLALIGLTELINSVAPFQGARVPTAIGVLYFGAWVLGAAISTIAVIAAVLRSHIREPLLHFARIPALMTTLAMAIMLVSTLIWGLSLRVAAPALFQGNEGVMGTHTSICWLMIVVVMVISTSVAGIALKRCFAADAAAHIPT